MRPRTRDRVQRILCAALLNSDLTEPELRQLVEELSSPNAYDFIINFGSLMRAVLGQLKNPQPKEFPLPESGSKVEDTAYNWIQRRRLSKKEVLHIMTETVGSDFTVPNSERPVRDLLRRFFQLVSAEDAQRFLARLQPRDNDPYLQGIMERR
jgi:hypothetical protein